MNMASLGDKNDLAGLSCLYSALDLDLKNSLKTNVKFIVSKCPLKSSTLKLHDAAAHVGRFLECRYILKINAVLLESLKGYCMGTDLDDAAGILNLLKALSVVVCCAALLCQYF